MRDIVNAFNDLNNYIIKEKFKGYDPNDILSSPFPFKIFGKWAQIIAPQIQIRLPFNIRPFWGVKKKINPKGMGILLGAYSKLYRLNPVKRTKENIDIIYNWLVNNYSQGYSGICWGYPYIWASPDKILKPYTPSIVATSFVAGGIFEYYKTFKDLKSIYVLRKISKFILNDLKVHEDKKGICFSYTPIKNDCCFNASMLGAEALIKLYSITKDYQLLDISKQAVDFVVSYQLDSGAWNYSINLKNLRQRNQMDFHQGYILDSLFYFIKYSGIKNEKYKTCLSKGLEFYKDNQFYPSGQSKWRFPATYPIETHHQAQGVITFAKFSELYPETIFFSEKILNWTISNMKSSNGFYYFRKYKYYTDKVSLMRWSQCFMLLAFAEFFLNVNKIEPDKLINIYEIK
ncbi:MAG: hypothetical protein KAT68_17250 [Bacteroidales bacterium]|nr:hypothetical protein [Bacteroidales bacterium]